jgi:hypothetical protein
VNCTKNDHIKNDRIKRGRLKNDRIKSDSIKTDRLKSITGTDPNFTKQLMAFYSFYRAEHREDVRADERGGGGEARAAGQVSHNADGDFRQE